MVSVFIVLLASVLFQTLLATTVGGDHHHHFTTDCDEPAWIPSPHAYPLSTSHLSRVHKVRLEPERTVGLPQRMSRLQGVMAVRTQAIAVLTLNQADGYVQQRDCAGIQKMRADYFSAIIVLLSLGVDVPEHHKLFQPIPKTLRQIERNGNDDVLVNRLPLPRWCPPPS